MRYYYAQIDGANVVFAVSDLSAPVIAANMVPIDAFSEALIGQVWDAQAQEFSAP
jgi:hypothetical protein